MGGKGKKGKNEKPIIVDKVGEESGNAKKGDSKEQEMNRIMAGINNMDLDSQNFLDTVTFDQSKAILDNSMDQLADYLKKFNKGDYKAFPRVKVD